MKLDLECFRSFLVGGLREAEDVLLEKNIRSDQEGWKISYPWVGLGGFI